MAYGSEILRKPLKIDFDVGFKNSQSSGKRPGRSKASEDMDLSHTQEAWMGLGVRVDERRLG